MRAISGTELFNLKHSAINHLQLTINKVMQIKFGEQLKEFSEPVSVLDAIKAFDRDVLKKTVAAKVNGEEVDLSRQLATTDEVLSIEPIQTDTRDGLEVLRSVKTNPRLSDIPVVVLTTSASDLDLERAYEHRANSYLVKPEDFPSLDELMKTVGSYWLHWNALPVTEQ